MKRVKKFFRVLGEILSALASLNPAEAEMNYWRSQRTCPNCGHEKRPLGGMGPG